LSNNENIVPAGIPTIVPMLTYGTIVGIPAGTIFSLLLKRAVEKRKKKS